MSDFFSGQNGDFSSFYTDPSENVSLPDPTSGDSGQAYNQAPASSLPSANNGKDGVPQAPWYAPVVDAGASLFSQWGTVEIAGDAKRQGINYVGAAPWISPNGSVNLSAITTPSGILSIVLILGVLYILADG